MIRVRGEPGRLDAAALDGFRKVMSDAPTRDGYVGFQLLMVDAASALVAAVLVFESRAQIDALPDAIEAAIDVAVVLIGGEPGAATVEVLDIAKVDGQSDAVFS